MQHSSGALNCSSLGQERGGQLVTGSIRQQCMLPFFKSKLKLSLNLNILYFGDNILVSNVYTVTISCKDKKLSVNKRNLQFIFKNAVKAN